MNKYLHIYFLSLLLAMASLVAQAHDDKDKNGPPVKISKVAVPAPKIMEKQAINALNEQLKGLNIASGANFVSSASFLAEPKLAPAVQTNRDSVLSMLKSVKCLDLDAQEAPSLSPDKFPVGFKKHFGANNLEYVAFGRAVIKPTHAELTAYVKMEMFVEDGQGGTNKKIEILKVR